MSDTPNQDEIAKLGRSGVQLSDRCTIAVAIAGLGYFSRLHQAAWAARGDCAVLGVTDPVADRVREAAQNLDATGFADLPTLLAETDPDIVDIIAPPPAHAALIRQALKPGRMIICQKPFCRSLDEAQAIADEAATARTALVIHENFRFQPWYRDIKDFLDSGQMGQVFQARFDLRPGDGRGPDAYLSRQPAFQTMQRLLIHETGVHFVDLFRWLFGDVTSVYSDLRRLNPAIAGEDAGLMILDHASGVQSVFDGNRLMDAPARAPRLTMGEMRIEGETGTLYLNGDGKIALRRFGEAEFRPIVPSRAFDPDSFGGGCVAALIAHAVDCHARGNLPENTAAEYLDVIRITEAAYRSHRDGRRVRM